MENQTAETRDLLRQFWEAMQTNDFGAAAALLSDNYVLDWPQSGERIRGPGNFLAVNRNYPVQGLWAFSLLTIIAEEDQAVSVVDVSDQATSGRAITFSTVRNGRIVKQVEYWPDPFPPAEWRREWVERM
jgi:ketosteroid isomerase-like protein